MSPFQAICFYLWGMLHHHLHFCLISQSLSYLFILFTVDVECRVVVGGGGLLRGREEMFWPRLVSPPLYFFCFCLHRFLYFVEGWGGVLKGWGSGCWWGGGKGCFDGYVGGCRRVETWLDMSHLTLSLLSIYFFHTGIYLVCFQGLGRVCCWGWERDTFWGMGGDLEDWRTWSISAHPLFTFLFI